MEEYKYQEFPKWKYSDSGSRLVKNADEEIALGKGWRDTPEETETKESIMALLDEQGATYDKRWGIEKLKAALK